MKNLFILLVGLVVLASCNTSYEKTKSGLRYKIIKGKGGKQLKPGDFVQYDQILSVPEKDTVISSTYGKMHAYAKFDTGSMIAYTPLEVFQHLRVGDSAIIVLSADSLVKKQMATYDNNFKRGGTLTLKLRITNTYATLEEATAAYEKEQQAEQARLRNESVEQNKKQLAEMDEYIRKNKINAIKTPSGAYVEVLQKGTGNAGDTGAIAQVFYTGKLLKEGTVFDSNIDPKFQHTDALHIKLGSGRIADDPRGSAVVPGFSEGLMYTGKGGKAKIYIPAHLGYGAQGGGPIPPNSALIFEIETREIMSAPAARPGVAAPQAH